MSLEHDDDLRYTVSITSLQTLDPYSFEGSRQHVFTPLGRRLFDLRLLGRSLRCSRRFAAVKSELRSWRRPRRYHALRGWRHLQRLRGDSNFSRGRDFSRRRSRHVRDVRYSRRIGGRYGLAGNDRDRGQGTKFHGHGWHGRRNRKRRRAQSGSGLRCGIGCSARCRTGATRDRAGTGAAGKARWGRAWA